MQRKHFIELFVYVVVVVIGIALLFMPKPDPKGIDSPSEFQFTVDDPVQRQQNAKELEDMVKRAYEERDEKVNDAISDNRKQ